MEIGAGMTPNLTPDEVSIEDIGSFVHDARLRNERGVHSQGDLIVLAMWWRMGGGYRVARADRPRRRGGEAMTTNLTSGKDEFSVRIPNSTIYAANAVSGGIVGGTMLIAWALEWVATGKMTWPSGAAVWLFGALGWFVAWTYSRRGR